MDKAYFDKHDVMERYGVGVNKALTIIRTIRAYNGGGALPAGKVLISELEFWERNRGRLNPEAQILIS